jgi:molecular chaperone GrpE
MDKKKNPFSEEVKEEKNEETAVSDESQEVDSDMEVLAQRLEELNNQYLRMAADFDNYRKRQAQERESLLKYGAENTIKGLLNVIDTFERALPSIKDSEDVNQVKESFEVVYKQFADALQKLGLKTIETEGKQFDPNLHEAVMQTPSEEVEDQTILQELQKGYMLEDRIIRAALVNVAINDK